MNLHVADPIAGVQPARLLENRVFPEGAGSVGNSKYESYGSGVRKGRLKAGLGCVISDLIQQTCSRLQES